MRVWKWLLGTLLLFLVLGGGAAWYERQAIWSWYVLRGLKSASENDRAGWVEKVAALREPPVEGLLDCLGSGDERACANAAAALDHLARNWGVADPRTADVVGKLSRNTARMCPRGQACVLRGIAGWLGEQPPSEGFVSACSRLLGEAAEGDDATIEAGMELAAALLRQPQTSEVCRAARDVGRAGLRSKSATARLQAVRLGLVPGIDLLGEIVALVHDPSVEVRRAAVLAVGPADQVVRDEGLLACLHDADAEVRRLAEAALKGRGLRPEHLRLGKLLTHPNATTRLGVLDHLGGEADLDPGLWLRRLSHDQSPAVRAAALRVMSQQTLLDLTDRIDQMARSDPSPTVAQMARFYLDRKRQPEPPSER